MAPGPAPAPLWTRLVFGLVVLATVGSAVWLYLVQERDTRQQAVRELSAIAELKAGQIAAWRTELIEAAADISERPLLAGRVVSWLQNPTPAGQAEILADLRVLLAHGNYADVCIVDPAGRVLLSVLGRTVLEAPVADAVGAAVRDGRARATDLGAEPDSVPPYVAAVATLAGGTLDPARPLGAVVLLADAQRLLYPLVQSWPVPSVSAETYLVRRDNDAALILHDVRHGAGVTVNRRIPLSATNRAAVRAVLGLDGPWVGPDYRGVQCLSVGIPVAGSPWFLVAKVDVDEAMDPWRLRSRLIILGAGGLLLLSMTLALLFWQREQKAHYRSLYEAEAARLEVESRHRLTLVAGQTALWRMDLASRRMETDGSLERLIGYDHGEIGQAPTWMDVTHPDDREWMALAWQAVIDGPQNRYDLEHRLVHRDGSTRWVEVHGTAVRPGPGLAATAITGTTRDITARKLAELRLAESQRRLETLFGNLPGMAYRCHNDADYTMEIVSGGALDLTGYRPDQIQGNRDVSYGQLIHPDDVAGVWDGVQLALRNRQPFQLTYRIRTATGQEKWVWEQGVGVLDAAGRLVALEGFISDVTERKASGDRIRQSEERLRLVLAAANQGYYDLNVQTGAAEVSPEYASMLGFDPATFRETNDAWLERMHPDDRPRVEATYRDYVAGRTTEYRVEFRQRTRSGDWMWILSLGKIVERDAGGAPLRMLGTHTDISAQKRAEESLNIQAAALEASASAIFITDLDARIEWCNPAFTTLTGYTLPEVAGLHTRVLNSGHHDEAFYARMWGTLLEGRVWRGELLNRRKDGSTYWEEATITPVLNGEGAVTHFVAIKQDITDRRRAEQERALLQSELTQAQKMESIGRLAGGVAHDFNNMLGVILGHADMALDQMSADSPLHEHVAEIQAAALRSADLTRQLLGFARRQTTAPRVLDINDTVAGMLKMLRRLIGEDVDLAFVPGPDVLRVEVDPVQLDQILANLAVNARDAISGVGRVTIETDHAEFDEAHCASHPGHQPGRYVMLGVSDNGAGMPPDVLAHVFEPFFTTKETGKGTGLGLATVYGIVTQNRGFVDVASVVAQGTTFRIYLPRVDVGGADAEASTPAPPRAAHGETVLLVEDEASVLRLGRTMLERLGYTVLASSSPAEALRLAGTHGGPIDLLVTDVVMPEMNGRALATELSIVRPGLKCLFVSGYTADVIAHRGVLDEGVRFLQKPYSLEGLATKVREVLEA